MTHHTHTWRLDLILCLIFHIQTAPDPSISTKCCGAEFLPMLWMRGIIPLHFRTPAWCGAWLCTGTTILLDLCILVVLVLALIVLHLFSLTPLSSTHNLRPLNYDLIPFVWLFPVTPTPTYFTISKVNIIFIYAYFYLLRFDLLPLFQGHN